MLPDSHTNSSSILQSDLPIALLGREVNSRSRCLCTPHLSVHLSIQLRAGQILAPQPFRPLSGGSVQ